MPRRELKHVPSADVPQVIEDFEFEGCKNITKESEGEDSDLWTVRADCPSKE